MTDAKTLGQALNALLQPAQFRDYGPNGLQVEGDRDVKRLVSGVTASRALIEAAIAAQADAIFVHHGLFWRGQDGRITGWMRERLRLLLTHGIHLFAYHLPLDAHAELGNNAQLAKVLGLQADGRFGDQNLGFIGAGALTGAGAGAGAQSWSNPRPWPIMWLVCWVALSLVLPTTKRRCGAWHGARVARKATLRPPLPRVQTPLLRVKSLSLRPIWREKLAWLFWPVVTTPRNAMVRQRWPPTWPTSWALRTVSLKLTTPL